MRKMVCALLALCLIASLSACSQGESAQLRAGQKLMEDYFSGKERGAVITESHAQVLRPDADKLALSDFVLGTFKDGGEEYEFAVNVVTGGIYTSERLQEFEESCIRFLEGQLGLNPSDCVGLCSVMELYAQPWQETNPDWPWEKAYLGHVIPAAVQDMDAYATQALSNEDVRLIVYLACRNTVLSSGRWTEADISDWHNTEVTLMALSGKDAALPEADELTVDYRNNFQGDRLVFSDKGITFTPGAEASHKTPEQQIDVLLEHMDVWYQGGSPDYYPAYLYYAVTDLNQNGRLEVISSEFRYDTNVSINRFFEVNEAETDVTEMDYDLAGEGGSTIAPGLVNAELPARCFFRDGAYHYSIPSSGEPNENLEIEYFFSLCVDQQGKVSTELLGEKWVSYLTDTTSYLHGLEEIEQRDYDAADLLRYEGCDCCLCTWEWVMLMEGWDSEGIQSELLNSWDGFKFNS